LFIHEQIYILMLLKSAVCNEQLSVIMGNISKEDKVVRSFILWTSSVRCLRGSLIAVSTNGDDVWNVLCSRMAGALNTFSNNLSLGSRSKLHFCLSFAHACDRFKSCSNVSHEHIGHASCSMSPLW